MALNFELHPPKCLNFSNLEDLETGLKQEVEDVENNENMGVNSCYKKKDTTTRKILQEIDNQPFQDIILDSNMKNEEDDFLQNFESLNINGKAKERKSFFKNSESCKSTPESGKKSNYFVTKSDNKNKKNDFKYTSQQSLDSHHSEDSAVVSSTNSLYLKPPSKKRMASSPLSSAKKFISLAEQVEHFQKDTPDRFRSKPKNITKVRMSRLPCIPKTPNLATKLRSRHTKYPDEKQREEMELEEIKKLQVRAYPLNKKILQEPDLNLKNPVSKKSVTIPQPFSLTEVKKKEPHPEPVFHFKAQPVPKTILNGPVGVPPKKPHQPTAPCTTQTKVPRRLRVEVKTPDLHSSSGSISENPQSTVVEPFSFDARMKECLQKKEDFIRKVIEEEKKAFNSFKALPMPSFKMKHDQSFKNEKPSNKTIVQPFNLTQPKANKSFSEEHMTNTRFTPFKAKPATVVHQKPFVPKLEKHEFLMPCNFHLKTELRAVERQKFDEKIKQKEEELAVILKIEKEEKEKLEKEQKLEERKKAEFKAKPVPKYKVFEIHGADREKLTHPESPFFSSKIKESKKSNSSHSDS